MSIQVISKEQQAKGAFNGGEIVENKPIGFPQDGGSVRPYSNLFYWAYAEANVDSAIGLHPHQGFEIMSFVLKGQIRHFDTKLNEWKPLEAGDAQIIRAGNGISHAEFLAKDAAIFQIWVDPDLGKTMSQPATYDDYKMADLPMSEEGGVSVRTYIGDGSPFTLDTQGLEIQRFEFAEADFKKKTEPGKIYSLYVIDGQFSINGEAVKNDDFIIIKEADELHVKSGGKGTLFCIASPAKLGYRSYAEIMQDRMRA